MFRNGIAFALSRSPSSLLFRLGHPRCRHVGCLLRLIVPPLDRFAPAASTTPFPLSLVARRRSTTFAPPPTPLPPLGTVLPPSRSSDIVRARATGVGSRSFFVSCRSSTAVADAALPTTNPPTSRRGGGHEEEGGSWDDWEEDEAPAGGAGGGKKFATTTATTMNKFSSRVAFKSMAVNRSILAHIESIGVGLRPRRGREKRPPRQSRRKRGKQRDGGVDGLLSVQDEGKYFRNRGAPWSAAVSEQSGKGSASSSSATAWWLPPPPFASSYVGNDDRWTASPSERHRVVRRPVKVFGSAGSPEELPRSSQGIPEIALAGRSNVGKSTLLNALLYGNQQGVETAPEERRYRRGKTPEGTKLPKGAKAVTSDRPGETQLITFYQLSSDLMEDLNHEDDEGRTDQNGIDRKLHRKKAARMSISLVDLPGYGFAYASEEKARQWRDLMHQYLLGRGKSLKRVLLLIDARHGFKRADFDFLASLQDEMKDVGRRDLPPIQIVLTKCDLVTQDDLARRVVLVREQLSDSLIREPSSLPVMLVSAKAGLGFNNVRGEKARGGVLELQRELAACVPRPRMQRRGNEESADTLRE